MIASLSPTHSAAYEPSAQYLAGKKVVENRSFLPPSWITTWFW
jgi:hypothetical protein